MPNLSCPVCKKFIAEVSGSYPLVRLRLRCLNNQCKQWHWFDLKTGETTPAPHGAKRAQNNDAPGKS